MEFREGDHVRYLNQQGHTREGTVQSVQGSGATTSYVIKDDATQMVEQVPHNKVEGRV